MIDLSQTTIKQFIKLIHSEEINLIEFYQELISFIKEKDEDLMAFQSFDENIILERVVNLNNKIKNPERPKKLFGVPVAVKDVINTIKLTTERGSTYWKGYTAGNNAKVVDIIEYEDGIITGKTVTAELAVHHPGKTRNPHNYDYSPGTSSMGSAVAVASGMSLVALGTQTGASIIRPASYTGTFGYKPSYGTIPRIGVLKTTDTLDHIGFFSNNIEDVILLFDTLRVQGANYPVSNSLLKKRSDIKEGFKIGVLRPQYLWKGYQDYVKLKFENLIDSLRTREIDVIDIENHDFFCNSREIHSNLYDKSLAYYFRNESSDKNVISSTLYKMVTHGKTITAKQFQSALQEQEKMQNEFDVNYEEYDIILTPSTANIAPKRDDYKEVDDTGLIWSLLGVPALNIPAFKGPDNMPFGLQAVGVKYSDYKLLGIIKHLIKEGYLTLDCHILNKERVGRKPAVL